MRRSGCPRHRVGQRNAAGEQQHGRYRRHPQALQVGEDVKIVAGERNVIGKRQCSDEIADAPEAVREIQHGRVGRQRDGRLGQADLEHNQKRYEKKSDEPQIGRRHDEPCAGRERSAEVHAN
jgi:hypothetical protein